MARSITIHDLADLQLEATWYTKHSELEVAMGDNQLAVVTDVNSEDEALSALQAVLGEVGLRLPITECGGC